MKIPGSFKIGSQKIKVRIKNKIMVEKNVWGESKLNRNEIWISTLNNKKDKIHKSIILQTFYHEKVHHILHAMNENDLCHNEKFVDLFATFLLQSDLTAKK